MSAERLTVWERSGNDLTRPLYTGTREECIEALRFLRDVKRWKLDRLELCYANGQCASFVINR